MHIKYAGQILLQCPTCHHESVHIFEDVTMCILCGWDRERSGEAEASIACQVRAAAQDPGSRSKPRTDVLELPVSKVQPTSKRARKRARAAALAAKAAEGT